MREVNPARAGDYRFSQRALVRLKRGRDAFASRPQPLPAIRLTRRRRPCASRRGRQGRKRRTSRLPCAVESYRSGPVEVRIEHGHLGRVTAKRKKAAEKGAGNDKKANVNDAVKMHTGKTLDDK